MSHRVTESPSKKIRVDTCDTRRQKSTSHRVNKSPSLQVKRYVQIPAIRGDRSLQVAESPSRQVAKSPSKKIRVDTCDTRRQESTSHQVAKSPSLQVKRYVQIPAIRGDRSLQVGTWFATSALCDFQIKNSVAFKQHFYTKSVAFKHN